MGKPARTESSVATVGPLSPAPFGDYGETYGWVNGDGSETRVFYGLNKASDFRGQTKIKTVYRDESYILQKIVSNSLTQPSKWGWSLDDNKGNGSVYGIQVRKKAQKTPVTVPANALKGVSFDAKYGKMGGKPIPVAPETTVAPDATVAPQDNMSVDPTSSPGSAAAGAASLTPGAAAGRAAGLDPLYNPLGKGTEASLSGSALAAGYTPLTQPQSIFVSQGAGGAYDQGQVSTSIYYEDDWKNEPITLRSQRGGIPQLAHWKDQVYYNFKSKLQVDQVSNDHTPSRPLTTYDALPLGTERQAIQPFRFKDIRLQRHAPVLNQINPYAPPVQEEIVGPAPPVQLVNAPTQVPQAATNSAVAQTAS